MYPLGRAKVQAHLRKPEERKIIVVPGRIQQHVCIEVKPIGRQQAAILGHACDRWRLLQLGSADCGSSVAEPNFGSNAGELLGNVSTALPPAKHSHTLSGPALRRAVVVGMQLRAAETLQVGQRWQVGLGIVAVGHHHSIKLRGALSMLKGVFPRHRPTAAEARLLGDHRRWCRWGDCHDTMVESNRSPQLEMIRVGLQVLPPTVHASMREAGQRALQGDPKRRAILPAAPRNGVETKGTRMERESPETP